MDLQDRFLISSKKGKCIGLGIHIVFMTNYKQEEEVWPGAKLIFLADTDSDSVWILLLFTGLQFNLGSGRKPPVF